MAASDGRLAARDFACLNGYPHCEYDEAQGDDLSFVGVGAGERAASSNITIGKFSFVGAHLISEVGHE